MSRIAICAGASLAEKNAGLATDAGLHAHLVASKPMELVVANDERDAVEHPLRIENRLVLHAGYIVEVDDDTELVK